MPGPTSNIGRLGQASTVSAMSSYFQVFQKVLAEKLLGLTNLMYQLNRYFCGSKVILFGELRVTNHKLRRVPDEF